MASLRQIRANRQNSQASSGPSEQGKLASRMNALKHGMSALELVFEDDSERLQIRVSEWMPELRAVGPFQLYQLERMAAASILIDRCKEQETDYRYRLASRTDAGRDLDLSVATEDIASGLPRRPARVARRLQQTGHGAEWLLARLRMLKELIGGPGEKGPVRPLDEKNRSLALDVLGVAPELRQGETVLDLPGGAGTHGEADLAAHQARVIGARIAELERFKTVDLAEVEAIDRDANAMGRETRIDAEIRLIRRYKKDAEREMEKSQAELLRLQAVAAEEARNAADAARSAELSDTLLNWTGTRRASAAPAASPAAPPGPTPTPRIEPVSAPPVAAAPDELHLAFEEALLEPVHQNGPRRGRDERNGDRPARAAHKGFPG
jgi:hypothetical protein